tara:strand:- start:390 stop:527 length:138 start_codon:yes stop_codon:yes gene_type:complete
MIYFSIAIIVFLLILNIKIGIKIWEVLTVVKNEFKNLKNYINGEK